MFSGHIDQADERQIRGWACDNAAPGRRLLLDLYVRGRYVGQVLANGFRADLKSAGISDGYSGFLSRDVLAAGATTLADVTALSPVLGRRGLWSSKSTATIRSELFADVASYLRATIGRTERGEAWRRQPDGGPAVGGAADRLLADFTADPRSVCLGRRISEYHAYAIHRYGVELRFDPGLSQGQYRSALEWYLTAYRESRPLVRIPLSRDDIAFLNSGPAADGEASQFVSLFRSYCGDDDSNNERVDWLIYNSASLGLDDCIDVSPLAPVTPAHLASGQRNAGQSLGIRRWLDRHPVLSHLPTTSSDELRQACVIAMLFAQVTPNLLKLIDRRIVQGLTDTDDGPSVFDRITSRWLGDAAIDTAIWRSSMAEVGFDLAAHRFSSVTAAGHRLEGARRFARGSCVDVQIIGPFSKALGIAQSCRMLAATLKGSGYSVRLCDFTIDYPNLTLDQRDVRLEDIGPARLNVIHLNFEEIPKAFAYLPDVFTGAINVACSYVELSRLAPEQELGCSLVDHVWAASRHIEAVVAGRRPVSVIGSAVAPLVPPDRASCRWRLLGSDVDDTQFVVLTSFDALSGLHRKNPFGVVRAFEAAFEGEANARLVIKTHGTERNSNAGEAALWKTIYDLAAADGRILILDTYMNRDDYVALLGSVDLFASLHRSEGLGYNILEAMSLGVACLVTDYSGPRDFCDAETAFLVGYRTVAVRPGEYPFSRGEQIWAEPDLAAAVWALRRAASDPELRRRLGGEARRRVGQYFSLEAFGARLEKELAGLLGAPTPRGCLGRPPN